MTKTFKHKDQRRTYDYTCRLFCKAETAPNQYWVETSQEVPANMMQLSTEWANGTKVTYYGFL
jgi:hypothetical protein